MPLLDVNGASLFYQDTQQQDPPRDRPAILFSHGLLWSGEMFSEQIAALRGQHRCVSYDHRGQGKSPQSQTPFDMETLYLDAVTIIEKLQLGPVHFVGLSMGGFVGMRLAARRPDLVRSLSLLETAADPEPWPNIPKYKALSFLAGVFGFRSMVRPIMRIMFGSAFLQDPGRTTLRKQMEDHLAALRHEPTEEALASVIQRKPILPELGRISAPTLVVHGEEDRAIVLPRAKQMAAAIKSARFVVVPRAGHTSSVEEPALVTDALRTFFTQLQAQS